MSATSVGEIGLDLVVNENKFNKQMSSLQSTAKKAGLALAAAFSVKKLVDFGKECLELGSDLEEVQNVVDVTFPNMTAQVDKFAKSAAASFGLSETMAKQYTGTFGAMAKAFGFSESEAYEMGSALTGLAGDVASFYNITQDEAYTKLKSVFTGETESLKDLGVVMTQTALDSYAMANGFGKTTSQMSEAEKVALRFQFVSEQLSAAQGDFARTSGSWANQVRILKLQFDSLKATIGQGLINLFTPIIKVVNTLLGKLATLANAFKAFTELITGKKSSGTSSQVSDVGTAADTASSGLDSASDSADSAADSNNNVAKSAKNAAKAMRSLAGFDKITKLDDNSSDSDGSTGSGGSSTPSSSGSLGSSVDFGSLAEGDSVLEETDKQVSKLMQRFQELAKLFKKGFKIGFGNSEKKIKTITKDLEQIKKSLQNIFTDPQVVQSANKLADSLALSLGKITGSVASIGVTIADNLVGGIAKYLQQSSGFIKTQIVKMLDAKAEIYTLVGDFTVALAQIFDVFSTPEAKQITADLIGIFSDGFLGVAALGKTFAADFLGLIVTPVTDNVDKIRLAFEGILGPVSTVLSTLHESLQTTFSVVGQMYEEHIAPLVANVTAGVSSIVSTFLDAWNTYISPVLDQLATKFSTVWAEHVQPLINTAIELIGKIADLISTLWSTVIQPIIEKFITTSVPTISTALSDIGNWVLDLVGVLSDAASGILEALGGVIDFFTGVFAGDWEQTTQGLEEITSGLKTTAETVFNGIRNLILQPFDNFLTGVFETDWSESFGTLGTVMNSFFDGAEIVWNGMKSMLNGIITFLNGVFTGNWEGAWETCVSALKTVFKGLVNAIKTPVNGVISLLNGLISAVNSLLATIESCLKFDFTIPNPLGGTIVDYHWKATLPRIEWTIPALAQGGFVEANTPQLAMIGDNRHQGEVVAPEDKLREMAAEAVKAAGTGGLTKDEVASIVNRAVMRIVSALSEMGFYLDSKQLAKATQIARDGLNRQLNAVELV